MLVHLRRPILLSLLLGMLHWSLPTSAAEPALVSSTPADGATDVDPNIGALVLRFDTAMKMNSWSLLAVAEHPFPDVDENRVGWRDPQSFEIGLLPLQPGTTYAVQLNSPTRDGFQAAQDQTPLAVTTITFTTAAASAAPAPSNAPAAPAAAADAPAQTAATGSETQPQPAAESGAVPLPQTAEERHVLGIVGATLGVFFHELGHALIDELKLPVTGREEDVVDEFATLLLTLGAEEQPEMATAVILAYANSFQALAEYAKRLGVVAPWWDEHAPDMNRFGNILCLLYGSDPAGLDALMQQVGFPQERRGRCQLQYEEKMEAWQRLMAPHLRANGASGAGRAHVVYQPTQSEVGRLFEEAYKKEGFYEGLAAMINEIWVLPDNIAISPGDCGQANAYWSPPVKSIFMCYELIELFDTILREQGAQAGAGTTAAGASTAPGSSVPGTTVPGTTGQVATGQAGTGQYSLVGVWQIDRAMDPLGNLATVRIELRPDGSFLSMIQSPQFQLRYWGTWEALSGAILYRVADWEPKQFCVGGSCQPTGLPPMFQVPIRFDNANQITVTNTGETARRVQ